MKDFIAGEFNVDDFHIGDVIEFPKHRESRIVAVNSGRIMLSQGVPGKFRVIAVNNGTIELERLDEGLSTLRPLP